MYSDEMDSSGMMLSFMEIGTGVQATLRFCLRNLRGCNVGIIDGWNLLIMPFKS
jgi:hypothetical protein